MNGQSISCTQVESWAKDLKRIVDEVAALPSEEPQSLYDNKIDEILLHLQAARDVIVVISYHAKRFGQTIHTYSDIYAPTRPKAK